VPVNTLVILIHLLLGFWRWW